MNDVPPWTCSPTELQRIETRPRREFRKGSWPNRRPRATPAMQPARRASPDAALHPISCHRASHGWQCELRCRLRRLSEGSRLRLCVEPVSVIDRDLLSALAKSATSSLWRPWAWHLQKLSVPATPSRTGYLRAAVERRRNTGSSTKAVATDRIWSNASVRS